MLRSFISKPAAFSYFTAVSAAWWSGKTALSVLAISIWSSFGAKIRTIGGVGGRAGSDAYVAFRIRLRPLAAEEWPPAR
jgi:hypothetical protein